MTVKTGEGGASAPPSPFASAKKAREPHPQNPEPGVFVEQDDDVLNVRSVLSLVRVFFIYFGFAVLGINSYIQFLVESALVKAGIRSAVGEKRRPGYVSLYSQSQFFWLRYMYGIIRDVFERPVTSCAGARADVQDRVVSGINPARLLDSSTECINLGSYNYLGFAQKEGTINDLVAESIKTHGVAAGSPALEAGYTVATRELEELTAEFVGKPAAMIVGMGFATNSTSIPALAGAKGTLILSDNLNHASIVTGVRDSSGARVRVFKHNDVEDLEQLIRDSIVEGQPRTHRPWRRIVIIIEGIYSMEGEIANLPAIVAVKKKYGCYLYLDEAHSIGALGPHGRGVCDYFGVNPDDIDVMMGTFTKSFGSVGGYIAGSKEMIAYLRSHSYGSVYSTAMSPPCATQALEALRMIMGRDGTTEGRDKIQQLKDNSNHFRQKLDELGLMVFGAPDSPVVPVMIYHPATMPAVSRELLARRIAIVVVGFPVTPLLLGRIRFCISAGHTKKDIDYALRHIAEVADMTGIRLRPDRTANRSVKSSSVGVWLHMKPIEEQKALQKQLWEEFEASLE